MTATTDNNVRQALVDNLNGLLADTFALYVKTKSFHWHVRGLNFRDLHLLFDEQATELFALTDLIAERVRKNGAVTLTSIGAIAARTRVSDQDDALLDAAAMIRELREDNGALISVLRDTKASASDAGDNASEGMIDDWTDQAERRVWFLESVGT